MLGWSEVCPPENFKILLSEIESDGIFNDPVNLMNPYY